MMENIESITTDFIREDHELSIKDDLLGYNKKSLWFLSYILGKSRPVSVGIFGKLGSGKSVFLNFLEKHAKKEGWKTIKCDVFGYLGSDKDISKFILKKVLDEYLKKILLIIFIVISVFFCGLFFVDNMYKFFNLYIGITLAALSIIFASPYLSVGLRFLYKNILVVSLFIEILDKVLMWFNGKIKYIIIVENIDRLSPDKALEFLENLKSLFVEKNSIFVGEKIYIIACDEQSLEKEVEKKYNGCHINVRDYLDKLIEFNYDIQDIENYNIGNNYNIIRKYLNEKIVNEDMANKLSKIFELAEVRTLRDVKSYIRDMDRMFLMEQMRYTSGSGSEKYKNRKKYFLNKLDGILGVLIIKKITPELFGLIKKQIVLGEKSVPVLSNGLDDFYCKNILARNPNKVGTKEGSFGPLSYSHDPSIRKKVKIVSAVVEKLFIKKIDNGNGRFTIAYLEGRLRKSFSFCRR